MKITFVQKAHCVTGLSRMGETLRQSSDSKLSSLVQPFYEFVGKVLIPGQEQEVFAILQRHDLDNGDHFFVIGLEVDGKTAVIHLAPPVVDAKVRKYDTLVDAIKKQTLRVVFLDEPRRFIGVARDQESLERYLDYIHMEQDVKNDV